MSVKRFLAALALAGSLLIGAVPAFADGATVVKGPAIWANGVLYGTVATPTELPLNEGNALSFDKIYTFPTLSSQHSIAEVGPGDPGFNGGRWMVFEVRFDPGAEPSSELMSYTDLQAYLGTLSADQFEITGPVRYFVCPLTGNTGQ